MSDPTQEAINRARAQGPYTPDPTGNFGGSHYDNDGGIPAIRVPNGRRVSRTQQGDMYLPHVAAGAGLGDLSGIKTAHLDEAEKQELLDKLLDGHNTHTTKTRDIELEKDRVDLENKKKFSSLGYKLMVGAGVIIAVAIVGLLGLLVYALINDKPMVDTGIFSAFLSTFVEMIKILFSIF